MAVKNDQIVPGGTVTGQLSDDGRSFSNSTSGLHRKYTVSLADLKALGAFTSGDVNLFELPEKAVITGTAVRPTTAVLGVGTAVGYVKADTSGHAYGNTSFNLKTAVSNTQVDIDDESQIEGAGGNVMFHIIVDTTCAAITAGVVDVYVDYIVR